MRWRGRRRSGNVEDRRGKGGVAVAGGGVGLLVMLVVALVMGVDPTEILEQAPAAGPARELSPADEEQRAFVEVVLASTEDAWHTLFQAQGATYREPTLVLFTDAVRSACGIAGAAVGPFYCPGDHQVYLDLGFFDALSRELDAPGDFARAYVVAHEVGHHVQTLTGVSEQVHAARRQSSEAEGNRLSVLQELQADCYAGVFAHDAARKNLLEPGDVEEALTAASAIGDDNLQQRQQGYVVPESFTHGTSEQRASWFRRGFDDGRLEACDTFAAGAV
ncbi:MAG: zinc metallopeptidase [Gemmatimonadetes bacterium]|nr:zinc metallopeptidase [Gemmatimonadota bacterium]